MQVEPNPWRPTIRSLRLEAAGNDKSTNLTTSGDPVGTKPILNMAQNRPTLCRPQSPSPAPQKATIRSSGISKPKKQSPSMMAQNYFDSQQSPFTMASTKKKKKKKVENHNFRAQHNAPPTVQVAVPTPYQYNGVQISHQQSPFTMSPTTRRKKIQN
jgi:hypothetical protein